MKRPLSFVHQAAAERLCGAKANSAAAQGASLLEATSPLEAALGLKSVQSPAAAHRVGPLK